MVIRRRLEFMMVIIILAAALLLATESTDAATPTELSPYSTITAANLNKGPAPLYRTPASSNMSNYLYYLNVPAAGTVAVTYYTFDGNGDIDVTGSCLRRGIDFTVDKGDSTTEYFRFTESSKASMNVTSFAPASGDVNAVAFEVQFLPNDVPTLELNKPYYHAGMISGDTKVKVIVPSTGYLEFGLNDVYDPDKPMFFVKTKGFKKTQLFSTVSGKVQPIGVRKGTYSFYISGISTPAFSVNAKFVKVKESKYGSKKTKAVKIKKNKYYKGVIVSDKKKVHWYKFKNPKKQKVTLQFKNLVSGGGEVDGGLKVTVYYKKMESVYKLYSSYNDIKITPHNDGKKMKKGTYYVKVESMKNGNGYFKFRWK